MVTAPDAGGGRAETNAGTTWGRRLVWRSDLFRRARLSLPSPSGMGIPMSRQELAEATNAFLAGHGIRAFMCEKDIGRYEQGETRWPGAHYRRALCHVLGASSDAALGFFKTRRGRSSADGLLEPALLAPQGFDDGVLGGVRPVRVVLHWNGRKAYALRAAMRLSVRDFAAKLGVRPVAVRDWRPTSTERLRSETHQILDAMLSRATDEDQLRFDIALAEIGESR